MNPLRSYQTAAVASLTDAVERGRKRIILRAPTGAGKTAIAREIIDRCVGRGAAVVFVAPRREIVDQTSAELHSAGIEHVVMQANHPPEHPVCVASIATLVRREVKAPEVCFLDEAHLHLDAAKIVVERFPNAVVIGLTATPERLDGRGLGEIYEEIIPVAETAELIEGGYLVPARVYRPSSPNLAGVRTLAGDYNKRDLTPLMDTPTVVGDVVATWRKLAAGRPTLVYAVSVEASEHLAAAFRAVGVNAEHVDAETPHDLRKSVTDRLRNGELTVACNVELFTYGLDVPRVSCISMARPTKSLALYLQMAGRSLRPFPGKENSLILDHAGNTYRHDLPEAHHEWSLEGVERRGDRPPSLRTCTECFAVYAASLEACPACGAIPVKKPREIEQRAGELVEVKIDKWSGVPEYARVRAYAKWLRTKSSERHAFAIFCAVFKVPPSATVQREARRINAAEGLFT
jgi:superfamily II DNA or RNA helicase